MACQTTVRNHGHQFDGEDLARIMPGATSQAEVTALLGTPSTRASFDNQVWYYVNRRVEEQTFFSKELTHQDVVRVSFDDTGTVEELSIFDMEDAKQVAFDDDATPTGGNELNVIEQFIGNIGRFNAPTGPNR